MFVLSKNRKEKIIKDYVYPLFELEGKGRGGIKFIYKLTYLTLMKWYFIDTYGYYRHYISYKRKIPPFDSNLGGLHFGFIKGFWESSHKLSFTKPSKTNKGNDCKITPIPFLSPPFPSIQTYSKWWGANVKPHQPLFPWQHRNPRNFMFPIFQKSLWYISFQIEATIFLNSRLFLCKAYTSKLSLCDLIEYGYWHYCV